MNARGIPPATQQVFTVLVCPGWAGGGSTYPGWGVPTLVRGYLPWLGGTYPGQGTFPGEGVWTDKCL